MELVNDLRAETRTTPRARALMQQSADCIEHLLAEQQQLIADLDGTKQALVDARQEQIASNNKIAALEANKKGAPEARKDLIRRLVAVTISVGFASQIVSLHILERLTGTPVLDPHFSAELARLANTPGLEPRLAAELAHLAGIDKGLSAELARLITAFFVILLGWDWYDRDVEAKPLGIARFILDAIIVMAELVLLLSSAKPSLWSDVLFAIFAFIYSGIFWQLSRRLSPSNWGDVKVGGACRATSRQLTSAALAETQKSVVLRLTSYGSSIFVSCFWSSHFPANMATSPFA
jgi:hypothetical protein